MTVKHLTASTFLRKGMLIAERVFAEAPDLLNQFRQEMTEEIYKLLDKIIEKKLI